jgi:oligopeptide/dipeptide ABC transporter ATP-binding protein
MERVLAVEDLVRHFRQPGSRPDVKAVNGVSLGIAAGETLALVGESGCGKSTLGRCVAHLMRPTSGRIHFAGTDTAAMSDRDFRPLRRRVQLVFQDPGGSLDPRMRIGESMAEPLRSAGVPKEERRERVARVAEQVKLGSSLLARWPHELSGGQQQRAAIARALLAEPDLIVLDEPTAALDVLVRAGIVGLLRELQDQTGVAYLFISHDLLTVRSISDRVAVMYLGHIVETGPTEDVFQRPTHPYTQALIGSILWPTPKAEVAAQPVRGEVPSATDLPSGCPFRTRCPLAIEACGEALPPLAPLEDGSGSDVRCIRAHEAAERRDARGFAANLETAQTALREAVGVPDG